MTPTRTAQTPAFRQN